MLSEYLNRDIPADPWAQIKLLKRELAAARAELELAKARMLGLQSDLERIKQSPERIIFDD